MTKNAIFSVLIGSLAFFCMSDAVADAADRLFTTPIVTVQASPAAAKTLHLASVSRVIDFAVNPNANVAAVLVQLKNGSQQIVFWQINSNSQQPGSIWNIPNKLELTAMAWHPSGNKLFVIGKQGNQYQILKTNSSSWNPTVIYHSNQTLENLVVGPSPFSTMPVKGLESDKVFYRLFFGLRNLNGAFMTSSITENGDHEYTVLGTTQSKKPSPQDEEQPKLLMASSAVPVGFHPAGQVLLWQDEKKCFHKANYQENNWGEIAEIGQTICGGNLAYTPNGAAFLYWKPGMFGSTLKFNQNKNSKILANQYQFIAAPQSLVDGKGLVGPIKIDNGLAMQYVPVNYPLADVANAWMFLQSPKDSELFSKNTGLFRPLREEDYIRNQLYQLYDTESYTCGSYDRTRAGRPYFVTTDIFWELYSAAFEGIFVVSERLAAIPDFWNFVKQANQSLKIIDPQSKMAQVFAAMMAVYDNNRENNAEAGKILAANTISTSAITRGVFNYNDLKPRSHYTLDSTLQAYFKAMKYLTMIKLDKSDIAVLQKLPAGVMQSALSWIKAYEPFIAPSRAPLIWKNTQIPSYVLHPEEKPTFFPLSWGVDNEILNSTIEHAKWPAEDQVTGRLLPSGLDLAAVLGSNLAYTILDTSGEFNRYPLLKPQIAKLKNRIPRTNTKMNANDSLYSRWINSLAVQWANDITSTNNTIQPRLWQTKRLQTGLASWATLRHATLLVNERAAAECGEGGFEEIVMQSPRGYVEPDPKTFAAIADLFDATINWVKLSAKIWAQHATTAQQQSVADLQAGIVRRLIESRDKTRMFGDIAAKEVSGKPLTQTDYLAIFHVGRAAEHNFLVFKSLAQKDYALSTPDPIPKIADVATVQNPKTGIQDLFLFAAVGYPLEWDQIVPFYGRKQIVKGAIYSYYHLSSTKMYNDTDWRKMVSMQPRPNWVTPYVSTSVLTSPVNLP